MAPHYCGFCCRSFSTWWAIMGQYKDFKRYRTWTIVNNSTMQYAHTHFYRHHSLELPGVFQIIVLVSNQIKYWSNYSNRFEISNIRTALAMYPAVLVSVRKFPDCTGPGWNVMEHEPTWPPSSCPPHRSRTASSPDRCWGLQHSHQLLCCV